MCEYLAQKSAESRDRTWVTTPPLLPGVAIRAHAAGSKSHGLRDRSVALVMASLQAVRLVPLDTADSWSGQSGQTGDAQLSSYLARVAAPAGLLQQLQTGSPIHLLPPGQNFCTGACVW